MVTKCHEMWLSSRRQFIAMNSVHDSLDAFMETSINLARGTCSKSSLQSDVGAVSRRSKLGAERVSLAHNMIPLVKVQGRPWNHVVSLDRMPSVDRGWFGNPSVRAVSKLCASMMQIALKVKLTASIQSLSPTLSLLEGSNAWIVLLHDHTIEVSTDRTTHDYGAIRCTCSLMDISHASNEHKHRLVREFITIVLIESGR